VLGTFLDETRPKRSARFRPGILPFPFRIPHPTILQLSRLLPKSTRKHSARRRCSFCRLVRSADLLVPPEHRYGLSTVAQCDRLRNPCEKQSAWRRHSFRKVFDSQIHLKCMSVSRARRCCSLCAFPDEIVVKTLRSAWLELFVSPRKCTRIARCRHRLRSRTRQFECRLVGCILAGFACQLDSAKVFTERRRSMGPDIAGPRAYR